MNKERFLQFVENIPEIRKINHGDMILTFCYYLQKKEKEKFFNHKIVETCFEISDLKKPTNIQSRLQDLEKKGKVVPSGGGYRIERQESTRIELEILGKPKLKEISSDLENLPKLLKKPESDYVQEVLNCLKVEAYHAAIILMWVITISHLRNFVLAFKLNEFNTSLSKHTKYQKKGLAVSKYDDFEEINEKDFLDLLKNANIISKGRHKLLDEKLGIRNTYAHPSSLTLTDTKTISFIEDLINDIITKIK